MLRLFIGLPLPIHIRQSLLARMGGVPGARWQADDQLHLTLRFLGNVETHQASDVDLAMQTVTVNPFDIALSGTGLFGTLAKPRMIWAGVKPAAPLIALEKKIDALVTRAGFPEFLRLYFLLRVLRGRHFRGSRRWCHVPHAMEQWRLHV